MGKGRAPCCDKSQVKKGPWSTTEDLRLVTFIQKHGHDNWRALPKLAGLQRCGKSCRLRWINYLRPDVKRGHFTSEEEEAIIKLHELLGNKWSKIASKFPGRTDNEIKNVWNTHLKKRLPQNEKNNINPAMQSSSCSSSSFKSCDDQNLGMDQTSEVTCNAIEAINNNESKNISYEPSLESDFDFWTFLDLDDTIGPFETNEEFGHEEFNLQVESMKWLRSLEKELGLEATTRDDHTQQNAFNDATDASQEVGDFSNDGLIKQGLDHTTEMSYFQLGPSSPFVI